ncbi:hypothetical protein GIW45_26005 [Pseudomonas congelans]|uniref:hypothetical protein n=1 Tax=Pseudomonas congelans TaxID=200452 RepID=UPI001F22DCFF|nr:hypothetical protein [Pseudomonas congelans]MCF5167404.1 hypothetical protein [Pseudomonas congelans]
MSITIKLSPLASPVPGCGFLQVRGWEHDAGNLEFAIQRNQDDYYLQHSQQWANAPCWFAQHFVEDAQGDSISHEVGPDIVDPLLQNSATGVFNFRLRNPDGSGEDDNPMKLIEGLALSGAGSATGPGAAQTTVSLAAASQTALPVADPASSPLPEPAEPALPDPIVEPVTPTPAPENQNRKVLLLIIGLALLAIIAAGLWFWLKKAPAPEPAPAVATTIPAAVAPAAAAPCSVEALNSENELSFVQGCIKQAPDSATLLNVIGLAKNNKQCGVAQRLYANRAQAGNVEVAQAYAREYDSKYLQPSACFTAPDNATAAYWYETILGYQADNAEAAQRLKELKP